MKRSEILGALDAAISKRHPLLSKQLRPGAPPNVITRRLKKVTGITEPVFDLYAWHDGTDPVRTVSGVTHNLSFDELGFFPEENFHFITLEMAVAHLTTWAEAAKHRPELKEGAGRYFPLFWDGSTAYLTVDLKPGNRSRVVFFENESDAPFRQAYVSFDDFLLDTLHANETDEPLRFFEEDLKG